MNAARWKSAPDPVRRAAGIFMALLSVGTLFGEQATWRDDIQPARAGNFTALPGFEAGFSFGWSNIPAASAEVEYRPDGDGQYELNASGETKGLARRLWKMDVKHQTRGKTHEWMPIRTTQEEIYAKHRLDIDCLFSGDLVRRLRHRSPAPKPSKWKDINVGSPLRDLVATMLFVRSQPLNDGDKIGLVAFPGDSPFFVQLKVEGRDTLTIRDRKIPAIRIDQTIKKIEIKGERKGQLSDHRSYRSGTIWISDDTLRLPLRSEVNIFIGYVYGEIDWVRLDGAESPLPKQDHAP